METINDLLNETRQALGVTSDNQMALRLNVSRATVSGWRLGKSLPDAIACEKIADLTGRKLAEIMGKIGEMRAVSREEKAVWRRLSTAAALVLALAANGLPMSIM